MSVAKIKSWNQLASIVQALKREGISIVFTNGCFDILHAGHVQYLEDAKALGDILIVGLNSDSSIQRLKGTQRPIVPENERARVLAGLGCVDYLAIFEQDTPLQLIELIQPDFLVKGGDWKVEDIVGSDIVIKNGGRVISLPYHPGLSTTSIVERISAIHDTKET